MTLEIPLTRGLVALVDDADFDAVAAAGKWYARPSLNTFYACRMYPQMDGKQRVVSMHTLVTGWGYVDHIDGDGLDNRRANLRPADQSKNGMNRALGSNNTSGFKGVTRRRLGWEAGISLDGRQVYLGTFATAQEAAHAYDEAALHHFAEFARPNFPQKASV